MMIQGRELLESEKIMESQDFPQVSEEIKTLMRQKKYHEVVQKCLKMTMSKQKYAILCYAYLGLKEWKNLIQSCDRGLQYDKKQPQFYSLKAKSLGKLGKNHEKILLLKQAILLNSSSASYHRNLGSAYYNIQSYDLAVEQYCKAIKLQPSNVMNYHNKGSALFKSQRYEQAKKCFEQALQLNPHLALTVSWLADCQKMLGNFEQAQTLYNKSYQMSGKQIYKEQIKQLTKQKNLNKHKGSWFYGLAWLGNKIM